LKVVKYESFTSEVMKALEKNQLRALEAASQFVLGETSLRCPVDTGNLKGSYHRKIDKKEKVAYIGTNVEYAPFVEFGTGIYAESGRGRKTAWAYQDDKGRWWVTRGARPQPHLRPAFSDNRNRIRMLIERELKA
jgi:HK97 gp10 family phage protein